MPSKHYRVLTLSDKAWEAHRQKVARVATEAVPPSPEERQSRAEVNLRLVHRLFELRRTADEIEALLARNIKALLSEAGKKAPQLKL